MNVVKQMSVMATTVLVAVCAVSAGAIPFERTVRYYAREQSPRSAERSARRLWTPIAENLP